MDGRHQIEGVVRATSFSSEQGLAKVLQLGLCASVRETVRPGLPLRGPYLLDIGGPLLAPLASRLFLQDVDDIGERLGFIAHRPSRCPGSPSTRQPQRRLATPHRKTPTTANLKLATSLLRARRSVPHRRRQRSISPML